MEMASRDDQACELYLAKQDSDNEEYVQVNHSITLLSPNPMQKAKSIMDVSDDSDEEKGHVRKII